MQLMPWQITRPLKTEASEPGKRMQPVYKVKRDKLTGEASLEVSETYDIQELTDSYAEQANPVAMMQRVRLGELNPWNGEDTLDTTQLPQELHEVPEFIGDQVERLTRMRTSQIERYIRERRMEHERKEIRKAEQGTESGSQEQ